MSCGWILWIHMADRNLRKKGENKNERVQYLGGTAACTVRGVKATREFKNLPVENFSIDEPKRCFYGDNWFDSVKAISDIAKTDHYGVMMIK